VQTLRAILRLTRLDSSLLAFFAIFLLFVVRTNELGLSFGRALPLLFIGMCTFIANDLDDVERDRTNHPERPLPARLLSRTFAVVLYFAFLASALFSTRHFVTPGVAFLYYALTALSISYGYVVGGIPSLKAPYVATVSTIPVLILITSYPEESGLYLVAAAMFFLTLGREMCMDIKDRAGDAVSILHRFSPKTLATVAFSLQTVALLLLAVQARKMGDIVGLILMALLLSISGVYWFKFARYRRAIIIMKLPLFIGLYFLI
jgi:4-hydroxybenzoate polyprenyltransferase